MLSRSRAIGLNGWNVVLDDMRPTKDAECPAILQHTSYRQQRGYELQAARRAEFVMTMLIRSAKVPVGGQASARGSFFRYTDTRMPVLENIKAIAKGMSITFREMFQPTQVENYPDGPGPLKGARFQERFRRRRLG